MTNGEKIQTILDIDKDCTEVYGKNGMMTFSVPQDWWNAEYKEPVIRDNGVKNELNRVKNELGVASGLEKNSKKLEKDFGDLDCISRAEVIDYLCKHCPDDGECFKDCDEIKHLRQMSSVTPQEQKTGHWIVAKGGSYLGMRNACCSNCKDFYSNDWNVMSYCPNCGARMIDPQESEDT